MDSHWCRLNHKLTQWFPGQPPQWNFPHTVYQLLPEHIHHPLSQPLVQPQTHWSPRWDANSSYATSYPLKCMLQPLKLKLRWITAITTNSPLFLSRSMGRAERKPYRHTAMSDSQTMYVDWLLYHVQTFFGCGPKLFNPWNRSGVSVDHRNPTRIKGRGLGLQNWVKSLRNRRTSSKLWRRNAQREGLLFTTSSPWWTW